MDDSVARSWDHAADPALVAIARAAISPDIAAAIDAAVTAAFAADPTVDPDRAIAEAIIAAVTTAFAVGPGPCADIIATVVTAAIAASPASRKRERPAGTKKEKITYAEEFELIEFDDGSDIIAGLQHLSISRDRGFHIIRGGGKVSVATLNEQKTTGPLEIVFMSGTMFPLPAYREPDISLSVCGNGGIFAGKAGGRLPASGLVRITVVPFSDHGEN